MADKPIGPGTVLAGRYRLEDLLSEADGAKFWRATDLTLARNVAINVVVAEDPRAEALLVAARTSATVTDSHFLRVLDAAEEDGVVYAVNEWGTGISLDRMLGEGPLPPRRAAWLVKEVADAITTAHANGIAHGRLVPENVMVTEAGSVKLIGFVVDGVLSGQRPVSPAGEPLGDHESDVEGLAALLYATLVGRWPGTSETSLPDAPREHGRPLRPRQVRAGIPRPLDAICDRVLGSPTQAGMRLETAHEICAALRDFIGDPAAAQVPHEATTMLQRADLDSRSASVDPEPTSRLTPGPPAGHVEAPQGLAPQAAPGPADDADTTAPVQGDAESDPEVGAAAGWPAEGDEDATRDSATEAGEQAPRAGSAGDAPAAPAPTDAGPSGDEGQVDPEATQAATPVFDDESSVGQDSFGGVGSSGENRRRRPAPPPPPPLPDPAPKPLFAEGPPRRHNQPGTEQAPNRTGSGLGAGPPASGQAWGGQPRGQQWTSAPGAARSGHGTGSLPPVWGPDAGDPASPLDRPARDPGKSWLRLAGVVAAGLLLVVAVIVAFNLGRDAGSTGGDAPEDSPRDQPDSRPVQPLTIAAVDDFDPQGDPAEENPELTDLAVDGRPETAWKTMTYYNNPRLGLLKDGVGLLVDLGEPSEVSQVRLTMIGGPNTVELLAAPEGAGVPTSTDGLSRVAAVSDAGAEITLGTDRQVTTQYLVVWLTSLPPSGEGYQGQIAEVVVRP